MLSREVGFVIGFYLISITSFSFAADKSSTFLVSACVSFSSSSSVRFCIVGRGFNRDNGNGRRSSVPIARFIRARSSADRQTEQLD